MEIVILKYNAGNIMSVEFALKRMGIQPVLTNDPGKVKSADKVIFPGVGEASTTMKYLSEHKLDILLRDLKQPVLGICLGLQLMCKSSTEGNVPCIGIFDEEVVKFTPMPGEENNIKVPHMGWNNLHEVKGDLFDDSMENKYMYFVHSYYARTGPHTVATAEYIVPFSAALQKDNFYATQFHPEKSGVAGARILEKFVAL